MSRSHETTVSRTQESWPNFFLIGAARAGTTTLYEYLKEARDVYLPDIKEPRYFISRSGTEDVYGRNAIGKSESYLHLFNGAKAPAIGEATPEYLYHDSAAQKIFSVAPDARIIVSVRNPVTRAFSHYLLLKNLLNLKQSFRELIDAESSRSKKEFEFLTKMKSPGIIECGFYSRGLLKYLDIFGRDKVKILIFEEWIKDPIGSVNSLLEFLGTGSRFNSTFEISRNNSSRMHENRTLASFNSILNNTSVSKMYYALPSFARGFLREFYQTQIHARSSASAEVLPNDCKELLRDLYRRDVQVLQEILGRTMPWDDFRA